MRNHSTGTSPAGLLQFCLRLAFYYAFVLLPMLHPSLAVSGDFRILWGLLVLIPLQAVLGFFTPSFPGRNRRTWLWPILLILISLPLMGWNGTTIPYLLISLWAYGATYLAFRRGITWLLYPEPFFMAATLIRLMAFSQIAAGAEEAAFSLAPAVMAAIFVAFTAYLFLLYRIAQRGKKGGSPWREALLLLVLFAAMGFIIAPLAPERFNPDLIRNDRLQERKSPPNPYDTQGAADENSNSSGDEGDQGQGEENQGNSLQVVSQSEWSEGVSEGEPGDQGEGGDGGPQQQYMVFVARSSMETAYMAEEYFGIFDSEEGFTADPDLYLNQLTHQRYLETWQNDGVPGDAGRIDEHIDVYSTVSQNYIPYYPYELEPTVRDNRYYPLAFSYRTFSFPSRLTEAQRMPFVPDITDQDREALEPYLELKLDPILEQRLNGYLEEVLSPNMNPAQQVQAILESLDDYQYQIGFTDDVSIPAIDRFLFDTKEGDCSEFSNAAALLGRTAGIPTRVVTGFLLSKDLQTQAHQEGLIELRKVHEPLAALPLDQLYLITTAHHHSWTQFYLPRYGWVDFESTAYAIPPPPGADMNSTDVVIPRIYPREEQRFMLNLPWGIMLRTALALLGVLLLFQYSRRRIALLRLKLLSRGHNEKGLKALYSLLIHRYNGREAEKKDPSLTPKELARQWPEFRSFAQLYESTLLNPSLTEEEKALRKEQLQREYRKLMKQHRTLGKMIRELLSLREVR